MNLLGCHHEGIKRRKNLARGAAQVKVNLINLQSNIGKRNSFDIKVKHENAF